MGRPNGDGQPRDHKGFGALYPQFWKARTAIVDNDDNERRT